MRGALDLFVLISFLFFFLLLSFPSRLFAKDERVGAICSTASIIVWLTFLFKTFSFTLLLDAYFMPLIFFICWMDLVTYLHHTDPELTYYRDPAWSFLKGALSTMDRSYGKIIDHLHHDIGTHMSVTQEHTHGRDRHGV